MGDTDTNVTITMGIPLDYISPKERHYSTRPPTFSGDSTQLEWWKYKMYTYIIGLGDKLWDILKDDIDIKVNYIGMMADRKTLTPTHKKLYKKHHRVRVILIESLP